MNTINESIEIVVEETLETFLRDFLNHPYRCYTEHGLHALFFAQLYDTFTKKGIDVYPEINGKQVCIIQKEYPTSTKLGKTKKQHWDLAILKPPFGEKSDYDYLPLDAIIEFGLNENIEHLVDDFLRVRHSQSKAAKCYIVHLYRTRKVKGEKISRRDWSENAREINDNEKKDHLVKLMKDMSKGSDEAIKSVREWLDGKIVKNTPTALNKKNDEIKSLLDNSVRWDLSKAPTTLYLGYSGACNKLHSFKNGDELPL